MRIPKGIDIKKVGENAIYVRGKLGIQKAIVEGVEIEGTEIRVENAAGREVIKRMIQGVSTGYKGKVKIHGVGYRATEGQGEVKLNIGFKDEKLVKMNDGVEIKITGNGTVITGKSTMYEDLRQSLSRIVEVRPARKDRYKGKGIA
jgi:large subunit ribosomal protein L6